MVKVVHNLEYLSPTTGPHPINMGGSRPILFGVTVDVHRMWHPVLNVLDPLVKR